MIRTLAFTGPIDPSDPGRVIAIVEEHLRLLDYERFVSGGAFGVDSLAARTAYAVCPAAEHWIVVPAALHNQVLVIWARHEGFGTIVMPDGTNYMDRNDRLVAETTDLLAIPEHPGEILRSGTWATIRRARKAQKNIYIRPIVKN